MARTTLDEAIGLAASNFAFFDAMRQVMSMASGLAAQQLAQRDAQREREHQYHLAVLKALAEARR